MKRNLLTFFFLLFLCTGYVCAQSPAVINGVWDRNDNTIKLFSIAENGSLHEIASSARGEDGTFAFSFVPQREGYYVIGNSPSNITGRYTFYFKPGDRLNLHVLPESYQLTGKNTPENKEMARWHDFIFPLEDKAIYYAEKKSTYKDFFPLLEDKLQKLKKYASTKTPNKRFNASFENYKKFDLLYNAIMFIMTPRLEQPKVADFIDYYRQINIQDLTKGSEILEYPTWLWLLQGSYMIDKRIKNENISRNSFLQDESDLQAFVNDTIKGELVVEMAKSRKSAASFAEYYAQYGKYAITDSQKSRLKNLEELSQKPVERTAAIDFKFADKDGKEYSLSDFKGKVVYVDIWATWCGPCKKEIPFLKKLEEEYHGNDNMVFIGVSVDRLKDKQKWIDFQAAEELGGVQIFAGDDAPEAIIKPYKIAGIPRFILVGKDGKLIFDDAPRPSSEEIRPALNSALKE